MANIAIVLAEGYEDSEFRQPYETLREHGHTVVVLGTEAGAEVGGKRGEDRARIERTAADADAAD